MTLPPKGPTIFHHLLQETVYTETVKAASNTATDVIAQIVDKNLTPKVSGLALLEIASIVQVIAINGLCRILSDKVPENYDHNSEISRLASIILHQRSLAPNSAWRQVLEWSDEDYIARYRVRSDLCRRILEGMNKGAKP